jgi:hypothetical protein
MVAHALENVLYGGRDNLHLGGAVPESTPRQGSPRLRTKMTDRNSRRQFEVRDAQTGRSGHSQGPRGAARRVSAGGRLDIAQASRTRERIFDGLSDDQLAAIVAYVRNALGIADEGTAEAGPTH